MVNILNKLNPFRGSIAGADELNVIVSALEDVSARLDKVEKQVEATRKKVYRDEQGGNGQWMPGVVANTRPLQTGDPPPGEGVE